MPLLACARRVKTCSTPTRCQHRNFELDSDFKMAKSKPKSESSSSETKAGNTLHAFDLLQRGAIPPPRGVSVLFGGQRFLKRLILQNFQAHTAEDDEFATARLEGVPDWAVIMDELMTTSLFGSGTKLVILDEAEDFVKKFREKLEDVVAQQRLVGSLVLIVDSWPSNTRLYKSVDQHGLQVNCNLPEVTKGRSSATDTARLYRWLMEYTKSNFQLSLDQKAARVLCDLTESNLGRIDCELAKLSLYVSQGGTIDESLVNEHVGGWLTKTMWETSDAIADGNLRVSLELLDRLLKSGEHPLALYGQLSWSLRRYPRAVEVYDRMRQHQTRPDVSEAVKAAGFRAWGDDVPRAQHNLKRIGRARLEQLGAQLLECDLALKGSHSSDSRARLLLECLAASLVTTKS